MGIEIFVSLMGSVGVFLSVIFLAFQIKKNTDAAKANFYDSLNKTNMEFLRQLVENERLGRIMEQGTESWESLSMDDKRTVNFLFIQIYRHWENMFYQNRMKVFEGWLWDSHKNTMISYFHKQGIKEWWAHRHQSFSKEFQDFLNNSSSPERIYKTVEELAKEHALSQENRR
jgi:hypothetical protein